jgi:hypothetical protein
MLDLPVQAWQNQCDMVLTLSGQYRAAEKITGPYELTVLLSDKLCKRDPDNVLKSAIDYLRRLKLIKNDSPKYARRIVVEWGEAPRGCRLILKPPVRSDALALDCRPVHCFQGKGCFAEYR